MKDTVRAHKWAAWNIPVITCATCPLSTFSRNCCHAYLSGCNTGSIGRGWDLYDLGVGLLGRRCGFVGRGRYSTLGSGASCSCSSWPARDVRGAVCLASSISGRSLASACAHCLGVSPAQSSRVSGGGCMSLCFCSVARQAASSPLPHVSLPAAVPSAALLYAITSAQRTMCVLPYIPASGSSRFLPLNAALGLVKWAGALRRGQARRRPPPREPASQPPPATLDLL